MIDAEAVQVVGDALIWLAAIPAVLLVIVYSRSPWWKSRMGRHLMIYRAVVALVLMLAVARQIVDESPAFFMFRVAVFVGIPVVLWWQLVILISAQRDARADIRNARREE